MPLRPLIGAIGLLAATAAGAQDAPVLVIKDHQIQPAQLDVPAGVRFQLTIRNQDPTPEEFESSDLNREKVVPGGKEIAITLGPLDPGQYKVFGDFHQATAHGVIVAK